jgi:hypothetical protein
MTQQRAISNFVSLDRPVFDQPFIEQPWMHAFPINDR